MDFATLIDAFALLLIFEGILPFVSPQKWRQFMALMSQQSNSFIWKMGLFNMLLGVALLYVVRVFILDN